MTFKSGLMKTLKTILGIVIGIAGSYAYLYLSSWYFKPDQGLGGGQIAARLAVYGFLGSFVLCLLAWRLKKGLFLYLLGILFWFVFIFSFLVYAGISDIGFVRCISTHGCLSNIVSETFNSAFSGPQPWEDIVNVVPSHSGTPSTISY